MRTLHLPCSLLLAASTLTACSDDGVPQADTGGSGTSGATASATSPTTDPTGVDTTGVSASDTAGQSTGESTESDTEGLSTSGTSTASGSSTGEPGTSGSSTMGGSTTGAMCGDGVAEEDEACDGDDLAGEDCVSQGFGAGELACADDCTFDTSACDPCGNDMIDGKEVCDGADLGGEDCITQGFSGGELGCAADCSALDTNACVAPSTFLLTERNSENIWEWDPQTGTETLYHSTTANDADCNAAEGSDSAWIAEHFSDHFGPFIPGSGMGTLMQYPVLYAYPKHVTVFDDQVVVMSRNDATIHWYDFTGVEQGSLATGNVTGQGMATNGTELWASFWNGATSEFVRYDAGFVAQESIANPTGLGANVNVVDFAYDAATGNFYGLVADFEGGTNTQSNTVVEFAMGGAVIETFTVGFGADGIGQQSCP